MLATLVLSQGVPMILGGDEMGRTQNGNNNAYCQDNEISWYDWANVDEKLLAFTKSCCDCGVSTRPCTAASSSRAAPFAARTCATSSGCASTARK